MLLGSQGSKVSSSGGWTACLTAKRDSTITKEGTVREIDQNTVYLYQYTVLALFPVQDRQYNYKGGDS